MKEKEPQYPYIHSSCQMFIKKYLSRTNETFKKRNSGKLGRLLTFQMLNVLIIVICSFKHSDKQQEVRESKQTIWKLCFFLIL